jgi:hypothetical protein
MSAAKNPVLPAAPDSLYDTDFFEWTQAVSEKLRHGTISRADVENVAEEIADMGKSERNEVYHRLIVLIAHLLKWQMQPERRQGGTWLATIDEQRLRLDRTFQVSPSLRRYGLSELPEAYSKACRMALRETGLRVSLPEACPYSFEQILDEEWFPPAE